MRSTPRYEVRTKFHMADSENVWTIDTGTGPEPMTFAAWGTAERAIEEFLRDAGQGGLDYCRDDFEIKRIGE